MRYVLEEKIFCLGDDYTICDQDGHECFIVDGRAFSVGNKLSFQDTVGNELAFIRQKLLAWGPTYEIYREGRLAAIVRKQMFTFFNCRFMVDVPGPDDLEAAGDFLDREYVFTQDDDIVATVSKRWFTLRDTYGVDIADGADNVLILASTAVIDLCCHDSHR